MFSGLVYVSRERTRTATVLPWVVLGLGRLLSATVLQWVVEVFHFDVVECELTFGFLIGVGSECDWVRWRSPLRFSRTLYVVVEVGLLRGAGRVG